MSDPNSVEDWRVAAFDPDGKVVALAFVQATCESEALQKAKQNHFILEDHAYYSAHMTKDVVKFLSP
jgi:hypothetical protein